MRFGTDSLTTAKISAPDPAVGLSSGPTPSVPVFSADSQTASRSQGEMVRRSIRSTLTRAALRASATLAQIETVAPQVTNVRSDPRERKRAFPIGANRSTAFAAARLSRAFRQTLGYRNTVGRPD